MEIKSKDLCLIVFVLLVLFFNQCGAKTAIWSDEADINSDTNADADSDSDSNSDSDDDSNSDIITEDASDNDILLCIDSDNDGYGLNCESGHDL